MEVLTVQEACELLKIKKSLFYTICKRENLQPLSYCKRQKLFYRDDLVALINRSRAGGGHVEAQIEDAAAAILGEKK